VQSNLYFSPLHIDTGTAASDKRDLATSPFASVGGAPAGQPQDYNKLFAAEAESLQLAEGVYKWVGDGIEERILRKYGKTSS
jgi:ER membrane protein complex subunit 3